MVSARFSSSPKSFFREYTRQRILPQLLRQRRVYFCLAFLSPYPGADFLIAKYPVTNHQFKRFVDAGAYGVKGGERPSWWSAEGWNNRLQLDWMEPRWWDDSRFDRPTRPVVGVSWYEAEAYCAWLNGPGREHKAAEGRAQLPSMAQWEAAARYGGEAPGESKEEKERDYPWQDKFDPALANTKESGLGQTTPVDMYPGGQTKAGVFDLAGNVWEWTSDRTKEGRYYLKGGSWAEGATQARAASRVGRLGNYWYNGGFRVVVVPLSRGQS